MNKGRFRILQDGWQPLLASSYQWSHWVSVYCSSSMDFWKLETWKNVTLQFLCFCFSAVQSITNQYQNQNLAALPKCVQTYQIFFFGYISSKCTIISTADSSSSQMRPVTFLSSVNYRIVTVTWDRGLKPKAGFNGEQKTRQTRQTRDIQNQGREHKNNIREPDYKKYRECFKMQVNQTRSRT